MGRAPCCAKVGLRRGPWTQREDRLLKSYIQVHGEGDWKYLPRRAGLLRCGKSCRLRWRNYLRPDIKRGNITPDEEDLIIRLHSLLGNRWSLIAGRLPGRTDNEIKNYWNSRLRKKINQQYSNSKNHHITKAEPKEPHIVKAHHPKPERAIPFSIQINDRHYHGPTGRGGEGGGSSAPQVHESPCDSDLKVVKDGPDDYGIVSGRDGDGGFCDDGVVDVRCGDGCDYVGRDRERDLMDGSDFLYHSTFVPSIDLEMIYGELSQLLNI